MLADADAAGFTADDVAEALNEHRGNGQSKASA
jgi:hypothetical protein